jgi:peptidoglycan/xylan/chitin deacetylase (PgdA/CDA1 family)
VAVNRMDATMQRWWRTPATWLLFVVCGSFACSGVTWTHGGKGSPPSTRPPAGLTSDRVPQFVVFGSDDNGLSGLEESGREGGMHFLTDLFAGRHNPAGRSNAGTFDGSPAHFSFYVNTRYLTPGEPTLGSGSEVKDDPVWVKRAWREAIEAGHEIGVHCHSHPHGREFTVAQWDDEMQRCVEVLGRHYADREAPASPDPSSGMGIPRNELLGFRTPFLEYSDNTLVAVQSQGFRYDCSLEEGTEEEQDGRDFFWPYRLDDGSPDDPAIGRHPGLWEIPVYVFIVPPDEECARFGLRPGFRDALKRRQDYFDVKAGKITGMDWNLWCEFAMTPAEFLATMAYTLELRLAGNRCPLTIGLHSELYSDLPSTSQCPTPVVERRAALQQLVDHVLSQDLVRVVSARELLGWLERPVPLR